MALTFFGDFAGNARVSVVPARLNAAAALRHDHEQEAAWRAGCEAVPELLRRAWLWSGLAIHESLSADVTDSIVQWTAGPHRHNNKNAARVTALHAAELCQLDRSRWYSAQLLDFYRRTVGLGAAGFREESLRFGRIGLDSVFSHALHWQEVPGYIDNLCEYVRAMPSQSLESIIAVFRQLILVHPFLDGNGRFARALATSLCASAGWPRYLLLPALVAFRVDSNSGNTYNSALAASSCEPFARYALSIAGNSIDAAMAERAEARVAQHQLADLLAPASFGRRMQDRLLNAPCISAPEFARISGSSERNALRWLARLSAHGAFDAQGQLWLWAPAVSLCRRVHKRVLAAIDAENLPVSGVAAGGQCDIA
ncbi:MAG: Fic family protein [Pseudomonadota bacterium]|nr:Fic family protein [Pseudomonadota bacterium]